MAIPTPPNPPRRGHPDPRKPTPPVSFSRALLRRLGRDPLLPILLALTLALALIDPRAPRDYLHWLDLPTLAGLCGLLVLTEGVQASGHVQRFASHLVTRVRTVRALAFALLGLSAALATVLTNDVALFLVVPLTLAIDRITRIPRQRLVIFEVLAVNAGATFSPIGNPQNLLLWQHSRLDFFGYIAALVPVGAVLLGVTLTTCAFAFPATPLRVEDAAVPQAPLDTRLFAGSVALLAAMVAALEFGVAVSTALGVLAIGVVFFRRVLARVDWLLLATFAAMFVGLGHLAALPVVQTHVGALGWADPRVTYVGGIVLAQLISNVPAAVLLRHYAPDATLLAAAVNVGSSGLMIGSLANLIALRLDGSRGIGWRFHAWSLPYLVVTACLVALVVLR
ncbi:MAG: SLC13 family permease [Rhodanobacteraceae bacterium]